MGFEYFIFWPIVEAIVEAMKECISGFPFISTHFSFIHSLELLNSFLLKLKNLFSPSKEKNNHRIISVLENVIKKSGIEI